MIANLTATAAWLIVWFGNGAHVIKFLFALVMLAILLRFDKGLALALRTFWRGEPILSPRTQPAYVHAFVSGRTFSPMPPRIPNRGLSFEEEDGPDDWPTLQLSSLPPLEAPPCLEFLAPGGEARYTRNYDTLVSAALGDEFSTTPKPLAPANPFLPATYCPYCDMVADWQGQRVPCPHHFKLYLENYRRCGITPAVADLIVEWVVPLNKDNDDERAKALCPN